MDCRSVSAAERVCDCDEGVQCPNERKPTFFMEGTLLQSGLACDRRCAVPSPGRICAEGHDESLRRHSYQAPDRRVDRPYWNNGSETPERVSPIQRGHISKEDCLGSKPR